MKSVEQLLAETISALEASGKKLVAATIMESSKSIEAKVAAAEEALDERGRRKLNESRRSEAITEVRPPVKKNLGANTRLISESQRTGRPDTTETQKNLIASLVHGGMSEAEAKIFAGVTDDKLVEAIKRGDTASDLWHLMEAGK